MKKITLSSAALLMLTIGAAVTVQAQSNVLYASSAVLPKSNVAEINVVNERAVNNFKKTYSTVANARWSQIPDGFMTKFEQNDIKFRIGYNKKGDWENTVRSYNENHLPADVKKKVEDVYYGYDITTVDEITTAERTVYIVHIENKEWSRQIKVDANETYELEAYEIKKLAEPVQ